MASKARTFSFSVGDALVMLQAHSEATSNMRSTIRTLINAGKRCETDAQKLSMWDLIMDHLETAESSFPKRD